MIEIDISHFTLSAEPSILIPINTAAHIDLIYLGRGSDSSTQREVLLFCYRIYGQRLCVILFCISNAKSYFFSSNILTIQALF